METQIGRGAPFTGAPDAFLRASIERVVSFNEETGQCLLDVVPLPASKASPHVLVSAVTAFVYPGLTFEGQVETCPGFLQAGKCEITAPHSVRTLKKFLKSGAFPAIGPKMADELAKAFPENLLSIFDESPDRLGKIRGVGRKRQEQILSAWADHKARTAFEKFLFQEGLPLVWAQTLWPRHGRDMQTDFETRPYVCAVEHDLPFERVDGYALKKGFNPALPERLRAALYDLLREYLNQGHCAYPEARLLETWRAKLGVGAEAIDEVLELELLQESLVTEDIGGTACVYLKKIWDLEREVAAKLQEFEHREPPWGWFNSQKIVHWAQSLMNVKLAPLQRQAIETALGSSLTVITGGPGTGKTTLIRALVTILQTQFARFALCSPTGRAAQRLEEATGAPARTIHRLLKYDGSTGRFVHGRGSPLDADLVLVDEASMIDLELMNHLLDALPEQCSLVLVGDADQIPSVGAGNVLQSLIESKLFPTVRLTDIFRQRERSLIKINAHRINSGEMPLTEFNGVPDFHYFPVQDSEEAKRTILDLVTRLIPERYGIRDSSQLQILVPMNRGSLGTHQLNEDLQKHLILEQPGLLSRRTETEGAKPTGVKNSRGQEFKIGDKVMVIKNDYKKDVFNGDVGFIVAMELSAQFIEIQFDQRRVAFGFDELDRLTLAYAISVHKSQGSEYRAVIVVVAEEHASMAQRHLIYTAVTRGKEQVFLVAHPPTLREAVLSDENNRRWQKLTERLSARALKAPDTKAEASPRA